MSVDAAGNLAVADGGTFTTPQAQAVFSVSSLHIKPATVNPNNKVSISVLVTNTGNISGNYTLTLKINGVAEATKPVTLGALASQQVTFTTVKNSPGTYAVDVNGLTGSFEVRGPVRHR